jgi:hypothetical protein
MLSQLARVTDTSQLQIEIQNDARPTAREDITARDARLLRVASSPAFVSLALTMRRRRGAFAARFPRQTARVFQERNAMRLREATALDSVQRNWIDEMR